MKNNGWFAVGVSILRHHSGGKTSDVARAEHIEDSALIAAAPALLMALESLLDYAMDWKAMTYDGDCQHAKAIASARDAIKKARGE